MSLPWLRGSESAGRSHGLAAAASPSRVEPGDRAEDDDGAGWSPIPPRRGRSCVCRSGGATVMLVDAQQPARAADALRAARTALVVAHGVGDALEHLALGLALRRVGLRARLEERQKRVLVHGDG